jgi:outer membrane lipoprotein-sorting protein
MNKLGIVLLVFLMSLNVMGQSAEQAKLLLDEVAVKMEGYENMELRFSQTLVNEDAGIREGDELPILGKIILQKEKYSLEYLGNTLVFDGQSMFVINEEEKEITVTNGNIDGDDGFIYPSKLLTFYKEGYTYAMGKIKRKNGRTLQLVTLTPMDSESSITKVQLAIDLSTKHINQLIQTGDDSSKTTFTITNFKSNQKLSETLFSLDTQKYSEKNGYTID